MSVTPGWVLRSACERVLGRDPFHVDEWNRLAAEFLAVVVAADRTPLRQAAEDEAAWREVGDRLARLEARWQEHDERLDRVERWRAGAVRRAIAEVNGGPVSLPAGVWDGRE